MKFFTVILFFTWFISSLLSQFNTLHIQPNLPALHLLLSIPTDRLLIEFSTNIFFRPFILHVKKIITFSTNNERTSIMKFLIIQYPSILIQFTFLITEYSLPVFGFTYSELAFCPFIKRPRFTTIQNIR